MSAYNVPAQGIDLRALSISSVVNDWAQAWHIPYLWSLFLTTCQLYLYIKERQGCLRGLLPKAITPGCLHTARWLLEMALQGFILFRVFEKETCNVTQAGLELIHLLPLSPEYWDSRYVLLQLDWDFETRKAIPEKKKTPYLIKSAKCAKLHKFTWTPCKKWLEGNI